ncbi:glyoxalase family protein [Paecilomyces variotii]|uniref:Glyoxalase family protein n=1 Tax=Byssochlamys spectabilis TaxID=264951 RepID=A0A443I4I6_BYSSP|nr:glyoxalase family protein [Paecilomyces variotii]KAJ9361871.1 hypothetical protein DTO280E4_3704 [Paecilomyces variotii]RWQ98947.1 glyoxalase family protein [Paecilomyces variotii]
MPLSHLTLTVSQLPQSTSFFLSCLQPLGYHFIGRHEDYIGFGSQPGEPADFWITEEKPGVPAGAAHVAFPAPSKDAVGSFFIQALKAGGKIHGEPKVRDADSGYFSAAVIDFDGNSIEAVYRPGCSSSRSAAGGRALTVVKGGSVVNGGSVVSRAKSTRSESVYSSSRSDFNKLTAPPAQSVVDIDRAAPSTVSYSMYQPQQAYQPQQQKSDDGSKTAKTIIGTLLGATAGAAIAYAITREATSSSPSMPEPQYTISAAPAPAPAQSRASEYQGTRAIEAGPAHSFYSDEDASTVYSRSKAPSKAPSKIARASTIYEGSEYYPVDDRAESVYSEQSGIQRTANGSVYATKELPIRAIDFPPQGDRRSSVPGTASSFISSFVDKSFHGGDNGSVCSSSTIKPTRRASADDSASHYSSRSSSSSHQSSATSMREYAASVKSSSKGPGSTYSTRTAREVPLPEGSVASFKSDAKSMRSAKDIPLPARSTVSTSSYRSDAKSMRSAKDIPLPAGSTISASSYRSHRSAKDVPLPDSASTVYHDTCDIDSHVTPDDSISQVGDSRRSTTRSHASHRSKSHSHVSHASKRSSKFDEPVKPSDSVSQVSTNVSRASQRTVKADDTRSKASSRRE